MLSDDAAAGEPATGTERVDGLEVVTIEEDGRWYVSVFYSLADAARRENGAPPPDFGNGIEPDGADSPEGAVRELVDAGTSLDVRRAIALMPPDEGRVLHDYAPLFIDSIEQAVEDEGESLRAEVSRLDLSTSRDGDDTIVRVDGFTASATVDGSATQVDFDGECAVITVDGEDERTCAGDANVPTGALGPFSSMFGGDTRSGLPSPDLGIVVVERDGEWYVSPIRTAIRPFLEVLRAIDREALDGVDDFFGRSLFGPFAAAGDVDTLERGPMRADSSDRRAQSDLRNALVAFKVGYIDAGEWPTDPQLLSQIEPSLVFMPYGGVAIPGVIAYAVDGEQVRLVTRGEAQCFYIADDGSTVSYAADARCGDPSAQRYTTDGW
jgi:hypothetical protein